MGGNRIFGARGAPGHCGSYGLCYLLRMLGRAPHLWRTVIAATICVAACSTSNSAPTLSLQRANSGQSVSVVVGAEIDITLQTIGNGSYQDPELSTSALIFLGVTNLPPNPGGALQMFKFRAVTAGQVSILVPHGGDDPSGSASTPSFTLNVTVTAASTN